MVSKGGLALKGVTTFLRVVELLGSILILGITSYWLAVLSRRDDPIPTWEKAVEGIAGAAVLYTAFAVLLTFFLGGKTFFAFLAVVLDVCFIAGFIAIAVLARGGTNSCSGDNPPSPIGQGERTSCRLQTAVFAVAIAMALCFLVSLALQILLSRHHKKEKRFGPGPSNDYTSGSGKKRPFWKRNKAASTGHNTHQGGAFGTDHVGATNGTSATPKKQPFWKRNKKSTHDAEMGTVGSGAAAGALIADEKHRHNNRTSYDTGVTGTTAASPAGAAYGGPNDRYNTSTVPHTNDYGHHANTAPHTNDYSHHTNAGPGYQAGTGNAYSSHNQGAEMTGAGHQLNAQNPEPYYGDLPPGGQTDHNAQSGYPSTTFGHGNYQQR
ncbi:MAG: hypothetical protein Q9215_002843 [Flavoplaca cf. flavocitrina]